MKKLLFIFFIVSQYTFAQLIVHSNNDRRLIAYHDSVKCYPQGLKEIRIAKSIKNKNDTAIGRFYKNYVEIDNDKLNPDIKAIAQMKQYAVLYKLRRLSPKKYDFYTINYLEQTFWIPEMWKKPFVKVVYEKLNKPKYVVKKDTTKNKSITYNYVFSLNGKTVTQELFEKFYGKNVTIKNINYGMASKN